MTTLSRFRNKTWTAILLGLGLHTASSLAAPDGSAAGNTNVVPARIETVTRTRSEADLNGLWRFQLADAIKWGSEPADNWGVIEVPGNWRDAYRSPIRQRNAGWTGTDPSKRYAAWYERDLFIPGECAGRQIVLQLDRVSTDAVVFVGGKQVGSIAWPAGEADLTAALRPGTTHKLRLLVVATTDEKEVLVAMGPNANENTVRKAEINLAGLIQPARVIARPQAHVEAVAITPSVRRHELGVTASLVGIKPGVLVKLTARLLDMAGKEEKTFTSNAITSVSENDTTVSVQAAWPWSNPRLWDVDQPELYTLALTVSGVGLDDEVREPFGFREFWIEGKSFFLNGSEIRLRPVLWDGWRSGWWEKKALIGFNFVEIWPRGTEGRGRDGEPWSTLFPAADQKGILVNGVLPDMGWMGNGIANAAGKRAWEQATRRVVARYRNHPSIVMWGTSANMLGSEISPMVVGQRKASDEQLFAREPQRRVTHERGQWGIDTARKLDSSRPIFIHNGGAVGDVYCPNWYPNWTPPLQERENLLSTYAERGDMPILAVEFGTPLVYCAMRGRSIQLADSLSEPLMTEYVAIYLGNEAYTNESRDYRAAIPGHFRKDQVYAGWHPDKTRTLAPTWLKMQQLFIRNTWRSWRTWGITGGMLPWDEGYAYYPDGTLTPAGEAMREVNGDLLAWICGPEGSFTSKAHHWRTGETLAKQAALLNDSRETLPFIAEWTVRVGEAVLNQGKADGTMAPGTTRFVPISATLPQNISGDRAEGVIELRVRLGEHTLKDSFPFTVFSQVPALGMKVSVIDPSGMTSKLLRSLGGMVEKWDGKADANLVVIGRQALNADGTLPEGLEAYVRAGGRMLVHAQEGRCSETLGFRVCPNPARRIFPIDSTHPVMNGLTTDDLRDWNAASTLAEAYSKVKARVPPHGWRWGNQGSVATTALEKPHVGGWRPILECEFDLAYSPLMELDLGQGRLIWCQLDLEDSVATDPVAERLARQIITYAATAPLAPRVNVAYVGDDDGRRLIDSLGIATLPAQEPWTSAGLVIVGRGTVPTDESLRGYLNKGGQLLVLPRQSERGVLGTTLKKRADFSGALSLAAWKETAGLSVSDLRRRTDGEAWLLTGGCDISSDGLLGRMAVGKGVAVFAQMDPDQLAADTRTYLRFTRWRQTRALAQLIANLGGESSRGSRVFQNPAHADAFAPLSLAKTWKALQTLTQKRTETTPTDAGLTPAATAAVAAGVNTGEWKEISFPAFAETCFGVSDGEAVIRTTATVPPEWIGQDLMLRFGETGDFDNAYVNGVLVGKTGAETPSFDSVKRAYRVPAKLVPKDGRIEIAIRLFGHFRGVRLGGIAEDCTLSLASPPQPVTSTGLYHPDYRADFLLGDDPYREYNW